MTSEFGSGYGNGNGRLSSLAAQIHLAQHQVTAATITTGRNLLLARRLMGSARDFSDWIFSTFGWSDETAEQLAGVAEAFGAAELGDVVDLIAPGALLILWPPYAAPAAAAAIAEARRGMRVSHSRAVELLQEHCPEEHREDHCPEAPAE